MPNIEFTKMAASGNDFIIVSRLAAESLNQLKGIAMKMCQRKYGIGADGVLLLGKSRIADIKMRIFNADGSEAEMCGNGARCAALYSARRQGARGKGHREISIETKAGIIESKVSGNNVKIKLTDPKNIKLDIPIKINNHLLRVNFINTGVPHTVIFVEGLEKIDVVGLGKQIRYNKRFAPKGTNVDFVEVLNNNSIKVRTYERGVEDETLACGTGAAASALIFSTLYSPVLSEAEGLLSTYKINVFTKSSEILKVYFNKIGSGFEDIWLEGKVKIVYKGNYYCE